MRIGFADQKVLWQGGLPHAHLHVGNGKETFARVGCVVTSVAMACRYLGARSGALPAEVNRRGIAAGAFPPGKSACVVRDLIDSQGCLISGKDFPGPGQHAAVDSLRPIIEQTIKAGGVLLVHVDYDAHLGGDFIGDHWCCAYAIEDGMLLMGDPATAKKESLFMDSLSGAVEWGSKKKKYTIKRVVSVFPF
jgi:hypothetical protein